MISVIVYGRNDDHGLRAQRRAALSINSLAATLAHDGDEIVFVDYNSDDHLPTFVEAVADTLTDQALARLRVVRVRPVQHLTLAGVDAPPVVESIARNIGLRHTDPNNQWILSTNPDVVIVTEGASLSAAVAGLEAGCYGSARLELPAFIWQRFDRKDPGGALAGVRRYAASLHLDERVRHYLPQVGFDAPGDFQLVPRGALFDIGGFDERMRQAWHVDANLMARLSLRFGPVRAMPGTRLYHCEHTVELAPKHRAGRPEDSFDDFVVNIDHPEANQGKAWGGQGLAFETLRPTSGAGGGVAPLVEAAIGEMASDGLSAVYGPETFGAVPRVNRHVLPFLVDRLAYLRRDTRFHWLGQDGEMRGLADEAMRGLGFTNGIRPGALDDAEVLLIDGPVPGAGRDETPFWRDLGCLVASEAARSRAGRAPRRLLALNAVHSDLETVLLRHFDVVLSPFTTRIRQASIKSPQSTARDWLPLLQTGKAGAVDPGTSQIDIVPGGEGHVFFGPNLVLQPGPYCLKVDVRAPEDRREPGRFVLEAALGDMFLAQRDVGLDASSLNSWTLTFTVPTEVVQPVTPGIEVRLWSSGASGGSVVAVAVSLEGQA